jgi:hypothetical protein
MRKGDVKTLVAITNICIRNKEQKPLIFFDGLSGTIYPYLDEVRQIKLNKILNISQYSCKEEELNLQKVIDKELFLKCCEAIYDSGSFNIYGDLVID